MTCVCATAILASSESSPTTVLRPAARRAAEWPASDLGTREVSALPQGIGTLGFPPFLHSASSMLVAHPHFPGCLALAPNIISLPGSNMLQTAVALPGNLPSIIPFSQSSSTASTSRLHSSLGNSNMQAAEGARLARPSDPATFSGPGITFLPTVLLPLPFVNTSSLLPNIPMPRPHTVSQSVTRESAQTATVEEILLPNDVLSRRS